MHKKASFLDTFLMIVIPFVLLVVFVAVFIGYREIRNVIEPMKFSLPGEDSAQAFDDTIGKQDDRNGSFMDFALALLVFGIFFVLFISSYVLGNNPIFLIVYTVVLFVGLLVSAVISYGYQLLIETSAMSTYMLDFPITTWIIKYFFVLFLVFAIANGIALYAKPEGSA